MNTTLNKRDLIILIKDTRVHDSIFENICHLGECRNGTWIWYEHALDELHEVDLFKLYQYCADSWKGKGR